MLEYPDYLLIQKTLPPSTLCVPLWSHHILYGYLKHPAHTYTQGSLVPLVWSVLV